MRHILALERSLPSFLLIDKLDVLNWFICENSERLLGGILCLGCLLGLLRSLHLSLNTCWIIRISSLRSLYWIIRASTRLMPRTVWVKNNVVLWATHVLIQRLKCTWLVEEDLSSGRSILFVITSINYICLLVGTARLIDWWQLKSVPLRPLLVVLGIVRLIFIFLTHS